MKKSYMKVGSSQTFLSIPMSLEEFIDQDDFVRQLRNDIYSLDLSCIEAQYKGTTGRPPYNVYDMFATLIYAYSQNIQSVRQISKACRYDVRFMWLMGMEKPNHASINNFQHKIAHVDELIMKEQIKLLISKELIDLSTISIDGTKVQSRANKYTNVYRGTVGYHERNMEDRILSYLSDVDDLELFPDEILELLEKEDITKLRYINSKSKNRKYEPLLSIEEILAIVAWLITLDTETISSNHTIAMLIKKIDGYFLRKLKYVQQREILGDRNSYSKTDPDASFMRLKNDSFDSKVLSPAYNIQMATDNGYILNSTISNKATDTNLLEEMLETLEEKNAVKSNTVILADPGYGSKDNFEMLEEKKLDYVIPHMTHRHESKRKYQKNPCTIDKFKIIEHEYAICPNGKRLKYIEEKKTTSVNGRESLKQIYKRNDCGNCPLKEKCTKGKKTKILTYDAKWQKRKQQEKRNFNQRIEEYKLRYIVEQNIGILKHCHKLSRFRHIGMEMNLSTWNLQAIAANLSRAYKKKNKICEQINITYLTIHHIYKLILDEKIGTTTKVVPIYFFQEILDTLFTSIYLKY